MRTCTSIDFGRVEWHACDAQNASTGWAEKHGALNEISLFLYGLKEDDWHHVGE
jgi:hypothetical protein